MNWPTGLRRTVRLLLTLALVAAAIVAVLSRTGA